MFFNTVTILFSVLFCIGTDAVPQLEATKSLVNLTVEPLTLSKPVFEKVMDQGQSLSNTTLPKLDLTNTSGYEQNLTVSNLNTTRRNVESRVYNTSYVYSGSSSNDSGLSGWAIAGIVIGSIVLLCCCGACGAKKSGHWENALVWVRH